MANDLTIADDDEAWLARQIESVRTNRSAMYTSAMDIVENWTEGRNVSRFHPNTSVGDFILATCGGPLRLGRAERNEAIVGLLDAGLSQRQVAEVTGTARNTVRTQVAQSDPPELVTGADGKRYAKRTKPVVVIEAAPRNVTPTEAVVSSSGPATRVKPLYQSVLEIRLVHQSEIADPLPDADLEAALAAMPKVHTVLMAVEERWRLRLEKLHPERARAKPVAAPSSRLFDDGVSFGHSRPAPKTAEKPASKSRFGR